MFWWIVVGMTATLAECLAYRRYRHRVALTRQRSLPPPRPALLEWAAEHRSLIPDLATHNALEAGLPIDSVFRPQYKPLALYGVLTIARWLGMCRMMYWGFRLEEVGGLRMWVKGNDSSPTLLFLHGFGFGVLPYPYILSSYVRGGYRVVAPEYPGVCFDGSITSPSIADYASLLLAQLPPTFHVISNSFGSYVHSCLLLTAPHRIARHYFIEPVCFYPYFGSALNFLSLQPSQCRSLLQLLSCLLISKDEMVLAMCDRIKSEVYWEAERHLDERVCIVLSANDYIVESHRLQAYFATHHPLVALTLLPDSQHGEALFTPLKCLVSASTLPR